MPNQLAFNLQTKTILGEKMNLTYRGIRYQIASQIEVERKPIAGKYRGITWTKNPNAIAILNLGATQLKYRGIAYCWLEMITTSKNTIALEEPHIEAILGVKPN
jgi:hypothetical protein